MMRRTATVGQLDNHPNLSEVLGVLAQLAHVTDDELPRLAAAWRNTAALAAARDPGLLTW
jgi:hypothetical protein